MQHLTLTPAVERWINPGEAPLEVTHDIDSWPNTLECRFLNPRWTIVDTVTMRTIGQLVAEHETTCWKRMFCEQKQTAFWEDAEIATISHHWDSYLCQTTSGDSYKIAIPQWSYETDTFGWTFYSKDKKGCSIHGLDCKAVKLALFIVLRLWNQTLFLS